MADTQEASTDKALNFTMPSGGIFTKLKYLLAVIGPASIITSTAMGPGTAASCVKAGAGFGYDMLWVIVISGVLCGGVAFIGAKATAFSGLSVYEFIESKTSGVFAKVLFGVVCVTWYMVIFSQGATLKHLNDIIFEGMPHGGTLSAAFFVVTLVAVGLIYTSGRKNAIKIASAMCFIMAALFFVNAVYVRPDIVELGKGLLPKIPPLAQAGIIAGLVGGSGPGTSALWYSYSVKEQKWNTPRALAFIRWDQLIFAFLFTIFSLGIFISGAAVLHPAGITVNSALDAGKALEPLVGNFSKWIFIIGFWGAVFTTVGGMSMLATYPLNDIFRTDPEFGGRKAKRYIWLGIGLALISGLVKTNALSLLVNFLGLLNIGGFIIIAILTYHTSSRKWLGRDANRWYVVLMCLVICAFNFYSVIQYVMRFI